MEQGTGNRILNHGSTRIITDEEWPQKGAKGTNVCYRGNNADHAEFLQKITEVTETEVLNREIGERREREIFTTDSTDLHGFQFLTAEKTADHAEGEFLTTDFTDEPGWDFLYRRLAEAAENGRISSEHGTWEGEPGMNRAGFLFSEQRVISSPHRVSLQLDAGNALFAFH